MTGNKHAGLITSFIVEERHTRGDVVVFSYLGRWVKAKADDISNAYGRLAVCLESGAAGSSCKLLEAGYIDNDSWTWTPNQPVYLSAATAGGLTQIMPIPGNVGDIEGQGTTVAGSLVDIRSSGPGTVLRLVGYAKTASRLFVAPGLPQEQYTIAPREIGFGTGGAP